MKRPNLSSITKLKFKNLANLRNAYSLHLDSNQQHLINNASVKIPELIQVAEMLFDMIEDDPNGMVHKMVGELLNEIGNVK